MELRSIVIDPGHGGKDNGAVWGYEEEDDINLIIAFLLRFRLEALGYQALLTRERDIEIFLKERCDLANKNAVDLFVSIHCDAWHNITARGMTVHIHPAASRTTKQVAAHTRLALEKRFPQHRQRGVRESNFHVLRETDMPAMLIECEFLSNPDTRLFLREPEHQLELADAIVAGIESANNQP